jgi:hypothetical protein
VIFSIVLEKIIKPIKNSIVFENFIIFVKKSNITEFYGNDFQQNKAI